jgi:hypothetical protein
MRPVPVRTCVGCAAGISLLVLGLRLRVADGQVSFLPYLDQWEAEIAGLLGPMAHGTLGWRDFFAPNNEHRVVLTRLLSWAAVAANGEWDNRVMVVLGFVLQAGAIAGTGALAVRCLGWARGGLVALVALWPALLVCDWENVVSGFQSQFHVLILGSLAAFALLPRAWTHRGWRWAVWGLALVLLGSMASGLLTASTLAVATWLIGRQATGRGLPPASVRFAAGCLALAAFGALSRPTFTLLDSLHAQRGSELLSALLAYGAWPLPPSAFGLFVLWLPWCLLTLRLVRRSAGSSLPPLTPFAWSIGCWVLLQAAALAWARAGLLPLVSSRYTEVLVWGSVANAGSLMLILPTPGLNRRVHLFQVALVVLWLGAVGGFQVWRSETIYRPFFLSFRGQTLGQERRLEAFMRTDDGRGLETVQIPEIPYFAARIIPLMRDPGISALLPTPLRGAKAERIRMSSRSNGGSSVPVHEGPLTRAAAWLLAHGSILGVLGAADLAALLISAVLRRQGQPPCPAGPVKG